MCKSPICEKGSFLGILFAFSLGNMLLQHFYKLFFFPTKGENFSLAWPYVMHGFNPYIATTPSQWFWWSQQPWGWFLSLLDSACPVNL